MHQLVAQPASTICVAPSWARSSFSDVCSKDELKFLWISRSPVAGNSSGAHCHSGLLCTRSSSACCTQMTGTPWARARSTTSATLPTMRSDSHAPFTTPTCTSTITKAVLLPSRIFGMVISFLQQIAAKKSSATHLPTRSATSRRGYWLGLQHHTAFQHGTIVLSRSQPRPGLVAMVCQRTFNDLVEMMPLHAHGSQAVWQA